MPDYGGVRSIGVDDCSFTWYDTAAQKLFRQPKASL
jgi:hypothetical protein